MKYVMFEYLGAEVPVIVPGDGIINHADIKLSGKYGDGVPISAGHVDLETGQVSGKSIGMGLKPRMQDAAIIKKALVAR